MLHVEHPPWRSSPRWGRASQQAPPECPVAVRQRVDGGAGSAVAAHLCEQPLRRDLARVVAARGLVVAVHLLPALDPAGADRRELAAVTEAPPTVGSAELAGPGQDRTRQPL